LVKLPEHGDTRGQGGAETGVVQTPREFRRTIIGIYGTAFFSLSMVPMSSILVPLWMVKMGASPLWIGIAIGVRSLLPLLLSIHGGVLMDRLGTRRVTLVVALVAVALFPAYALMPWMAAIIILQMIFGLAQGLCWVGSQTFYGYLLKGQAGQAGRLVFFSNGGCFVGPLLVGVVVEFAGAHAGFGFMCLWAALMVLFTLFVPSESRMGLEKPAPRWRDLIPRAQDYKSALRLCLIPVVTMVMAFTFIRIAIASVQTSFYIVYLGEIHMGESLIGLLLGMANLIGTLTPPLIQPLARKVSPLWILVGATVGTTFFMTMTPLFSTFLPLLLLSACYGAGVGLGFPTLLTLLSKAVGEGDQGKSVGLRTSFNRLGSLIIPILMGAIAEGMGIQTSFFVVGIGLGVATLLTTLWARRQPDLGV
jgi:MFS family permease